MKITKTLKEIIEKSFNDRISNLNNKYEKIAISEKHKMIETIKNDEDYIKLIELRKSLSDKYCNNDNSNNLCHIYSDLFEERCGVDRAVSIYNFQGSKLYQEELNKIISDKNNLLLELEYEKDTSKLSEVLKKFNINI